MSTTTALTYAELRSQVLIRSPLDDEFGRAWQEAMGEVMDEQLVRTQWAARAGWPEWAPEDALLYIGEERLLEQVELMGGAGAREEVGLYRTRLREAWDIHALGGTQDIHEDSFGWTGLTNVQVFRRKEWSMPIEDNSVPDYVKAFQRSVWSQFDVLIEHPHPWSGIYWGASGLLWGAFHWGSTATSAEIDQLRRLLWNFRAAHDTPMWIVVNLGHGKIWGGFHWGDGSMYSTATDVVRWLVGEPHWRQRGLI